MCTPNIASNIIHSNIRVQEFSTWFLSFNLVAVLYVCIDNIFRYAVSLKVNDFGVMLTLGHA